MITKPSLPAGPLLLLFVALLNPWPNHATAQSSDLSDEHAVETAMKDVVYHYSEPVAVHVLRLQGYLTPTKPGATVFFDDKNSFTLVLTSAEISISCSALAQVLNENVFSAGDAPIKNLSIESRDNQLIMKGKLPQKAGVAFEMIGSLSADADGRIRVHAAHLGYPVAGDDRYGEAQFNETMQRVGLRRMFLHSHSIGFVWPETGEEFSISVPLPDELSAVLTALATDRDGRADRAPPT